VTFKSEKQLSEESLGSFFPHNRTHVGMEAAGQRHAETKGAVCEQLKTHSGYNQKHPGNMHPPILGVIHHFVRNPSKS